MKTVKLHLQLLIKHLLEQPTVGLPQTLKLLLKQSHLPLILLQSLPPQLQVTLFIRSELGFLNCTYIALILDPLSDLISLEDCYDQYRTNTK